MTALTPAPISSVSDVIADAVTAARKRLSMTRDELAAAVRDAGGPEHFTGTALRNLETGRRGADGIRTRDVSADELVLLAAAIGCPPASLLGPFAELFGVSAPVCSTCAGDSGLLAAVETDIAALADLDGVENSLAETARTLARAIAAGADGGKALPALTKELRATLEAIMAGRRAREVPDEDDDDVDGLDEPD